MTTPVALYIDRKYRWEWQRRMWQVVMETPNGMVVNNYDSYDEAEACLERWRQQLSVDPRFDIDQNREDCVEKERVDGSSGDAVAGEGGDEAQGGKALRT